MLDRHLTTCILFALVVSQAFSPAHAAPAADPVPAADHARRGIAMILQAKDAQIVSADGEKTTARPMQVLEAGQLVETGESGSVRFTLLADGKEHEVAASSSARVEADRVIAVSGRVSVRAEGKKLSLPRSSRAVSRRLLGEMVRGRSGRGRFLHPINLGAVPDGKPELRWELTPEPTSVTLVIEGEDGELVHEQELVGTNRLSWPPEGASALEPGRSYYAEVTAQGIAGAIAVVEFRVLDTAEAATAVANEAAVEEMLDADPADAAPLMLLALAHLESDLVAEARAVIERLERYLPASPELHVLKAHVLARSGEDKAAEAARRRARELGAG